MQKNIKLFFAIFAMAFMGQIQAQIVIIKGKVVDAQTNAAIKGVKLLVPKTDFVATSDENGVFEIKGLEPGFYTVIAQLEGYKDGSSYEQLFTYDKQNEVIIEMESLAETVGPVNISRSALQKRSAESPVSSQ